MHFLILLFSGLSLIISEGAAAGSSLPDSGATTADTSLQVAEGTAAGSSLPDSGATAADTFLQIAGTTAAGSSLADSKSTAVSSSQHDSEATVAVTELTTTDSLSWDKSLILPEVEAGKPNIGIAGAFAGWIGDNLVVLGGANFPDGTPAEGGQKKYWADGYIFNENTGWQVQKDVLPKPIAYGVSATVGSSLICIGGCNSDGCLSDVYKITIGQSGLKAESLPSLPFPLANATGTVVGGKIYVAGGNEQDAPSPKIATKHFLVFDPESPKQGWKELQPWPGSARGYAVSVCQSDGYDNCFYLFSGRDYKDDDWTVLDDGYCYNSRLNEWKKVDGSFPVMAGTALPFGTNHILFLGGRAHQSTKPGEDTSNVGNNALRIYHTVTKTMVEKDLDTAIINIPVTTVALKKGREIAIVSGEVAPGIRTPIILRGRIDSSVHRIRGLDIAVIVLYFVLLAFMGWYFSKRQKSVSDYYKGGGRVNWFIVGLSIFGTSLSAITFMSMPAKAYATDWSYMLFNAGIILVVPLITMVFIPYFRKLNIATSYEYLELRFNSLTRVICSIFFILFQIGRMAVVLLLPAIALNIVSGFNIYLCICLMGLLSLLYTMSGGIEAVVWTEALQVVVLLGAAIAIVVSVCCNVPGGTSNLISTAAASGKFSLGETFFDLRQPVIWTVLIATVFTCITTYGTDQTIVQRYFTTKTADEAKKGVYTNAILTIPATLIFFFLGTAIWVFYKFNPSQLSMTVTEQDAIMPWYFTATLPKGVLGLVIAGLFAAAMSTISSSMNASSMAFSMDIFRKIRPKASEKTKLMTARLSTLVLGLLGVMLAVAMVSWDIKSLWDQFNTFLGLLLGGLGGLFLLGIFTKRANSIGALTGLAACMIVQIFVIHFHWVNLLLYSTTGFISCFVVGYLVSLITPREHKADNLPNAFGK
jgi:SSS family solute:Na+ symporter